MARGATHYVDLNVGPAPPGPRGATHYVDLNVGPAPPGPRGAVGYVDLGDVTDGTPTPHLWELRPTLGSPGDLVEVIGYGFGEAQITYDGAVQRFDPDAGAWVDMTPVAWRTTAPTANAYTAARTLADVGSTSVEVRIGADMLPPGYPIRVKTDGP